MTTLKRQSPSKHGHWFVLESCRVLVSFPVLPFCILSPSILFQEEEQHTRLTKLKEEEMKRRHDIEKKRLPKIQRDEIKSKTQQYRKSLRIEKRVSVDIEREMMKEVTWKACFLLLLV